MAKKLKIISWNVNGLRAVLKKDFFKSVSSLDPSILLLQETKLQKDQRTDEMLNTDFSTSDWSYSTIKKGYSGVTSYSKIKPANIRNGIGISRFDDEGRILESDYGDFILFNVYFPNGQMSEERLQYKYDFFSDFFNYTDTLRNNGRSIIIAGDFNIAHNEIDLKNPKPNSKRSGFLREERDVMDHLLSNGYIDTFRHLYPDTVEYSWWSYRFNARANNAGWRIDYFFVSEDIIEKGWLKDAFIDNGIFGSDHCPIGIILEI